MPIEIAGDRYCNCVALKKGLDPGGYAGYFQDAFIMEVPLPWKATLYSEKHSENWLPEKVVNLLLVWQREYDATGQYPHRPLFIAPDDVYSREGYRRFIAYTRPAGLFAAYEKTEYLVPDDRVGDIAWAWYQEPDTLDQFETYRVDNDTVRDILVCTHGTVDAACAKFGYPLYKHLRETYARDDLRVWRVSHFGGHVFAPTLMDMPTGHYWAYVDADAHAQQIIERSGDVDALRGHYRGWAGVPGGFVQAAEREGWQQHGWSWFMYPRAGDIIAQDDGDDPRWADIRLRYTLPGESEERVDTYRIEIAAAIETSASSGEEKLHAYPQYRLLAQESTR